MADIAYVGAGFADAGQLGLFAEAGEQFRDVAGDLWNNAAGYFRRKKMKRSYIKAFGRANDQGPPFNVLKGTKLVLGQNTEWSNSIHRYGSSYKTGRIDKLLNATIYKDVVRFAGMNPMGNATRFVPLDFNGSWNDITKFPFYVFNLTAIPYQGYDAGISAKYCTIPGYRLQKHGTLTHNTRQYQWKRIDGISPNNSLNYRWQKETVTSDYHPIVDVYRHCWSNIELLLNTPAQCAGMTMHVALIKFVDNVGPRREYYRADNTTPYFYDSELSEKEMQVNDSFWEEFMAHRVVHPMARFNVANKNRCIKYLKHIQLKCDGASLTQGNFHKLKLFFNNGRIYNPKMVGLVENQGVASENKMITEIIPGAHGDVTVQTLVAKPGNYNQISSERAGGLYDVPSKDVWLAVWTDMYNTEFQSASTAECSFDFSIRAKFEMPFTIGANAGGANQNVIMPAGDASTDG